MPVKEPEYQIYVKIGASTLDNTIEVVVSAEGKNKKDCIEMYDHVYELIKDNLKFENIKKEKNMTI